MFARGKVKNKQPNIIERGYTMMEMIAVLGIFTVASPFMMRRMMSFTNEVENLKIASKMQTVEKALNNYVAARSDFCPDVDDTTTVVKVNATLDNFTDTLKNYGLSGKSVGVCNQRFVKGCNAYVACTRSLEREEGASEDKVVYSKKGMVRAVLDKEFFEDESRMYEVLSNLGNDGGFFVGNKMTGYNSTWNDTTATWWTVDTGDNKGIVLRSDLNKFYNIEKYAQYLRKDLTSGIANATTMAADLFFELEGDPATRQNIGNVGNFNVDGAQAKGEEKGLTIGQLDITKDFVIQGFELDDNDRKVSLSVSNSNQVSTIGGGLNINDKETENEEGVIEVGIQMTTPFSKIVVDGDGQMNISGSVFGRENLDNRYLEAIGAKDEKVNKVTVANSIAITGSGTTAAVVTENMRLDKIGLDEDDYLPMDSVISFDNLSVGEVLQASTMKAGTVAAKKSIQYIGGTEGYDGEENVIHAGTDLVQLKNLYIKAITDMAANDSLNGNLTYQSGRVNSYKTYGGFDQATIETYDYTASVGQEENHRFGQMKRSKYDAGIIDPESRGGAKMECSTTVGDNDNTSGAVAYCHVDNSFRLSADQYVVDDPGPYTVEDKSVAEILIDIYKVASCSAKDKNGNYETNDCGVMPRIVPPKGPKGDQGDVGSSEIVDSWLCEEKYGVSANEATRDYDDCKRQCLKDTKAGKQCHWVLTAK